MNTAILWLQLVNTLSDAPETVREMERRERMQEECLAAKTCYAKWDSEMEAYVIIQGKRPEEETHERSTESLGRDR